MSLSYDRRKLFQSPGGGAIPPRANLELWLKADAITGLVDNDPVATWIDSSGNSNDATQAVAANQPLYRTNIINGLPIVRFDAVNDGMGTPNAVFTGPFSIFVVYSGTVAAGSHRAVNALDSGFFIGTDTNSYVVFNGALLGVAGVVNGQFIQATYIQDGAASRFWVSGVLVGTNALQANPQRLSLGNTGLSAGPLNGDIAEVLGYVGDQSGFRVAIEAYLTSKYGL